MKTSSSDNNDASTSTGRAKSANGIGATPRKRKDNDLKTPNKLESPFETALELGEEETRNKK
jgi:hypothetical protein